MGVLVYLLYMKPKTFYHKNGVLSTFYGGFDAFCKISSFSIKKKIKFVIKAMFYTKKNVYLYCDLLLSTKQANVACLQHNVNYVVCLFIT